MYYSFAGCTYRFGGTLRLLVASESAQFKAQAKIGVGRYLHAASGGGVDITDPLGCSPHFSFAYVEAGHGPCGNKVIVVRCLRALGASFLRPVGLLRKNDTFLNFINF